MQSFVLLLPHKIKNRFRGLDFVGKEGISKLTVSVYLFYFLLRKARKKLSQVFESPRKVSQTFLLAHFGTFKKRHKAVS
jgi:hypothetical protein